MIRSWDSGRPLILVALLCACALLTPTPALAATRLTAEPSGSVGAGRISATPSTVTTPTAESVTVTWLAAAEDNLPTTEGPINVNAEASGAGQATYGALAGRAQARASSSPHGPHGAAGVVHLNLAFRDTVEVVSSTLAPGSPVTLTFVMMLDATATQGANGVFTPGTIGASAVNNARILDIEAGTGTPTLGPHTLVDSLGNSITLTTFQFSTAIGHHLQIDVDLLISAGVSIEPLRFTGQISAGTADVIADQTAEFFYRPSGDVRLVSESGHDYAIPISGSAADEFLCSKSKSTAGNLCAAAAPLNAGAACQIEEDCGGNSLDPGLEETSYCLPNKFPKGLRVSLLDPLEPATRVFDVQKPVNLCAPASTAGDITDDPGAHLQGYQITLTKGRCADAAPRNPGGGCTTETDCSTVATTAFCAVQPKFVKQLNLSVSNQFHLSPLILDALKPDRLLVPTAKSPTAPPGPPTPSRLDHYKCYQAKLSSGTPKFAPILGVPVDSQLTAGTPRVFDLKKPTRLCLSAEKNGQSRNDESAHLLCYQALPAKQVCAALAPVNPGGACTKEEDCGGTTGTTSHCAAQARFQPATGLFVNNPFGPSQVDATKEEELCVPSTLGGS